MDPNDRDLDDEETLNLEDDAEGSDAGSGNDEGGDDAQTGQELEDVEGQERVRSSRADRRFQALSRQAREADERAARLERELQEERNRRAQPQQQQPQEEPDDVFNARIAMLEPEARMDAKLERANKRHQQQLLIARMQMADAADRAAFQAKTAYDPYAKKYAAKVEELLASERRQGRDFQRETVLNFLIGEAVRNNKSKPRQQQEGQQRIRREQARADSGRSDVTIERRRGAQTLEQRLDGVII